MATLKAKVTVNIDYDKIVNQSKLNRAQKQLVNLVRTKADPYVPYLSGDLKTPLKKIKKALYMLVIMVAQSHMLLLTTILTEVWVEKV